jgi:hypothetical protein
MPPPFAAEVARFATADRIGDYPCVRFLAQSRAILNEVMQGLIEAALASAGFDLVRHQLVPSEVERSRGEYAEKMAFRADSILTRLTDQEFADELAALRGNAATAPPDESVIELINLGLRRHRQGAQDEDPLVQPQSGPQACGVAPSQPSKMISFDDPVARLDSGFTQW